MSDPMAGHRFINHPAYPVTPYPGDESNPPVRSNSGMSMRDYFAAKALSGLDTEGMTEEEVAEWCWRVADEMMRQRSDR